MKSVFYSLIITLSLYSCKPENGPIPSGDYSRGVFVVNEGIYGQTSGTITFYDEDSSKTIQDIFRITNNRDLGNVVQSMYFQYDRAYIVVNNSNKIEVVDADNFKELAQINGLEQPRYFLPVSADLALVSQWGLDLLSGSIALVDLNTNTVIQKISQGIGKGPEQMLKFNDKVYIANVGGLDFDNFISVFDLQTLTVTDTIIVDDAPNSMKVGADYLLWVACKGKPVYSTFPDIDSVNSTYGSLVGIDLNINTIQKRILLQKGRGASNLIKSSANVNDILFLYNNAVYSLNTATEQIAPIISGNYYGLGAKPGADYFYASKNSGIQASKVYAIRYSDAVKLDSFTAGIFANAIIFKP